MESKGKKSNMPKPQQHLRHFHAFRNTASPSPHGPVRYRLRFTGCILRFFRMTIYWTEVHQRWPFCQNSARKLERRSLRGPCGRWGTSEQPTILKNFPVFVPFYLPKRPLGLPPSLTSRYEPADAPRSNLYSKLLHLIWKSVRFSP